MKVLTCKSGLVWKSLLQTGHLYLTCPSQNLLIQVLQKLCPHGVETGLLNTSRQMQHEKFSSDPEVLAEAIPRHRRQGLCIEQVPSFFNSLRKRGFNFSESYAALLTLLLFLSVRLFVSKWDLFSSWKRELLPRRIDLASGNVTFCFLIKTSSPLLP